MQQGANMGSHQSLEVDVRGMHAARCKYGFPSVLRGFCHLISVGNPAPVVLPSLQDSFFTSYLNRTNVVYSALLPGSVNTQLGYKAIYGAPGFRSARTAPSATTAVT